MKLTGLLGGSFNPAHGAHRAVSLFALDALGLDEVWWLVSPGNPLKPKQGMASLETRFRSAKGQARRAPIKVTAIERELGTVYTIDTLRALKRRRAESARQQGTRRNMLSRSRLLRRQGRRGHDV